MKTFIASYDLTNTSPSPYGPFLEAAQKRNWSTWLKADNGRWYLLPNTTLVGAFADHRTAEAALEQVRQDTERAIGRPVRMPKWIVSERASSRFDSDETR